MMAVYVDDMFKYKMGEFRGMKMSHMIADTEKELLEMADKIGVKRKWIQKKGTQSEHFDVCLAKRAKAISLGAKAITWGELGEITLNRNLTLINYYGN